MSAVACLLFATSATQADPNHAAERPERAGDAAARVLVGRTCSAHKAVRFYSRRINEWRNKMGQRFVRDAGPTQSSVGRCPAYLAKVLKRKAADARKRYAAWFEYQFRWQAWLPAKWYRIARCETSVRWDWNSGTYQGAFGFFYGTWDRYKPRGAPSEAYLATPRQQYQAALNVYAHHGYGAWGCGNA